MMSTVTCSRLCGRHEEHPGLPVAERVLLPVQPMVFRLDLEAVARDGRSGVRRRAQANEVRSERDGSRKTVVGPMDEAYSGGHALPDG